jgi:PAS domain S-box-containing protein
MRWLGILTAGNVDTGWSRLFATAFTRSRNAMLLSDGSRRVVDANAAFVALLGHRREALIGRPIWELVVDGPLLSDAEWTAAIAEGRFDGKVQMHGREGPVAVHWAASAETITGEQRVLFVALNASRWGARFRRDMSVERPPRELSPREREVVHLVALGAAGPEIADELQISPETVRTHVRNAMEKLGARSRAHLVARALGGGHTLA